MISFNKLEGFGRGIVNTQLVLNSALNMEVIPSSWEHQHNLLSVKRVTQTTEILTDAISMLTHKYAIRRIALLV